MEVTPALVLSMWAAGLAGGAGAVASWRIVGPGYTWLAGGVTLLLGIPAAMTSSQPLAWTGVIATALVVVAGRRWALVVLLAAAASASFVGVAMMEGSPIGAVSGALFLGGVTAAMMLGHWYLVDPRLPRWALRRLAWVGAGGAALDFAVLVGLGVFPWAPGDGAVGVGFIILVITSLVLMLAVVGALRERGYSGVMAATGLSYLALLTAIGAAVIGRLLVDGPVVG